MKECFKKSISALILNVSWWEVNIKLKNQEAVKQALFGDEEVNVNII